jgi:hypothetical protein
VEAKQTGASPPLAESLYRRQETGLDLWVGLYPADISRPLPGAEQGGPDPLKAGNEGPERIRIAA